MRSAAATSRTTPAAHGRVGARPMATRPDSSTPSRRGTARRPRVGRIGRCTRLPIRRLGPSSRLPIGRLQARSRLPIGRLGPSSRLRGEATCRRHSLTQPHRTQRERAQTTRSPEPSNESRRWRGGLDDSAGRPVQWKNPPCSLGFPRRLLLCKPSREIGHAEVASTRLSCLCRRVLRPPLQVTPSLTPDPLPCDVTLPLLVHGPQVPHAGEPAVRRQA